MLAVTGHGGFSVDPKTLRHMSQIDSAQAGDDTDRCGAALAVAVRGRALLPHAGQSRQVLQQAVTELEGRGLARNSQGLSLQVSLQPFHHPRELGLQQGQALLFQRMLLLSEQVGQAQGAHHGGAALQ